MKHDDRARILRRYGAGPDEIEQLLVYTENRFPVPLEPLEYPLDDEPHLVAWRQYAERSLMRGVFPVLKQALVQLRFPIEEGISQTDAYRAATLRGLAPQCDDLRLSRPDALRLILHPTPAGTIPVLIAPDREDFVALVQALGSRNEPTPVPQSMGATIISGLVNWNRVAELRRQWEHDHPFAGSIGWSEEMARIRPRTELYQDRLIVLSTGSYSGIVAEDIRLRDEDWLRLSLTIRLEHECTHYMTRRLFGSMRNNAFDEILADYVGIICAEGTYRPNWLLHFFGLELWPSYRAGGRLENYRGDPPLSHSSFQILHALARDAALALTHLSAARFSCGDMKGQGKALLHLSALTLPELAAS